MKCSDLYLNGTFSHLSQRSCELWCALVIAAVLVATVSIEVSQTCVCHSPDQTRSWDPKHYTDSCNCMFTLTLILALTLHERAANTSLTVATPGGRGTVREPGGIESAAHVWVQMRALHQFTAVDKSANVIQHYNTSATGNKAANNR